MADFLFTEFAQQNLRSGTDIVLTSGRETLGIAPARYVSDALATAALFAAHPRFVGRSSNGRYWRAVPELGRIAVEVGGAKGDGVTDDGPAIRAAHVYAAAINARGLSFGSARYRLDKIPPAEATVQGNPMGLLVRQNDAPLNFGGSMVSREGGGRGIVFDPAQVGSVVALPLANDVSVGASQLTLASGGGAQLAAGDTVVWQLGELPYDTPETLNWSFATVVSVAGDVVTIDRPVPEALILSSVAGSNKRLLKLMPLRDWSISDLTLVGPLEDGVSIRFAERVRLERIGGRAMASGTIAAQYCDGLTLEDCWQDGASFVTASHGAAFNFAEVRNTLLMRPRARASLCLVNAEAGAQVTVIGGMFENTLTNGQGASLGSQIVVFNVLGRSSLTVHDLTITGHGGYRLMELGNGAGAYDGVATFSGTLRLNHPTAPYAIPLNAMTGTLDITIAGTREIYNFERLRHWRKRFVLRDGEYRYAYGPAGLLARVRVYATAGLTVGAGQQLTAFYLGRLGDNGNNLTDSGPNQIEPGKDVNVQTFAGAVGGAQWNLRNQPLAILCATSTNAGLNAANEFVEIEAWFAEQPDLDVTLSEDAVRMAGIEQDPLEAVFPGYDLPAIAPGASITLTLPIPDMAASDYIDSVRFVGGFQGLELRSAEPLAGAAKLVITNPGTAAIDRAATELGISFHHEVSGR